MCISTNGIKLRHQCYKLMFDKDVIHDNKDFLYLSFLSVIPVGMLFKGIIDIAIVSLFISLALFLKDSSLKKLRTIRVIHFYYYSVLFSGLVFWLISAFIIKSSTIVDGIYYFWIFYFFIATCYTGHIFNKTRYKHWYKK